MENIILIAIIAAILGLSGRYVYRQLRSGNSCMGCSQSNHCNSCKQSDDNH